MKQQTTTCVSSTKTITKDRWGGILTLKGVIKREEEHVRSRPKNQHNDRNGHIRER